MMILLEDVQDLLSWQRGQMTPQRYARARLFNIEKNLIQTVRAGETTLWAFFQRLFFLVQMAHDVVNIIADMNQV